MLPARRPYSCASASVALSWRSSDLAVRPGQLEDAVGQVAVVVLLDQRQRAVARLGDAGDDVDACRLVRLRSSRVRGSRRSDRAPSLRCRTAAPRCIARRVGDGSAAADELARGRSRTRSAPTAVPCTVIRCIIHGGRSPRRARPARAEDRLPLAHELGLHEQVAERRMRASAARRRQHDLGVAGQLDRARRVAAVGDADAAQLDVVFGRDADLGVRVDVAVAAAEFGAALREDRLVARSLA